MNSARALSGVGTVQVPCALYRHLTKTLGLRALLDELEGASKCRQSNHDKFAKRPTIG